MVLRLHPSKCWISCSGAAKTCSVELFCYVLTEDIDKFYRIQGELFLAMNDIFKTLNFDLFS